MRTLMRMIKPWDIIIILLMILLSFVPYISLTYGQFAKTTEDSQFVASISVNGNEIKRINLTNNLERYTLNLPEVKCNPNAVEVVNEKIRITKSTCPEQICVNTGYISKPGIAIICLPHRVVIEIETTNDSSEEIIISS